MDNAFFNDLKEKWKEIEKIYSEEILKNVNISGVELLIFSRNSVAFYFYINNKSLLGVLIKSKDKFFFNENNLPKAKNWKIINSNKSGDDKINSITMILENKEFEATFKETVNSLVSKIYDKKSNGNECVLNFFNNLNEIKNFFDDETYPKRLSEDEQVGLFGELVILNDFILQKRGIKEGLECWTGPSKKHDFTLPESLLEVKTTSSPKQCIINASSMNQLSPEQTKPLYLIFQRLNKKQSGKTLPEYINEISENISADSNDLLRVFSIKLLQSKYFESQSKYYFEKYDKGEQLFFNIKQGFPHVKISYSDAISNIKFAYKIDLDKCLDFKINKEKFDNVLL